MGAEAEGKYQFSVYDQTFNTHNANIHYNNPNHNMVICDRNIFFE